MAKQFITEKGVSAITGRAPQTLRNDRSKGRGFPFYKIGKSIKYDEQEIIAIMEKNKVVTSSFEIESKGKEN